MKSGVHYKFYRKLYFNEYFGHRD